jgi:hypothetical protein
VAILSLLSSRERIPPLLPLPWRERVGVRGEEVSGPNMLSSMFFVLCVHKKVETMKWGSDVFCKGKFGRIAEG